MSTLNEGCDMLRLLMRHTAKHSKIDLCWPVLRKVNLHSGQCSMLHVDLPRGHYHGNLINSSASYSVCTRGMSVIAPPFIGALDPP